MCIGSPLRALNYFWTKSPFSISVAFSDVMLLELQCNLTCHLLFQLFLSCLFLISVAVMSNGNKQTFRIHPVQNQFSITKPFGFEVGGWASFLTAKVQSYPTRSHPIAMKKRTAAVHYAKFSPPGSQALVKGHTAVTTMAAYKPPHFDFCFLAVFGLGFVAGAIWMVFYLLNYSSPT